MAVGKAMPDSSATPSASAEEIGTHRAVKSAMPSAAGYAASRAETALAIR